MDSIRIHTRRHEAVEAVSIAVHGHIDTATSVELEKELQRVLRQKQYRIVIDLHGVEYISSAGWGIFLSEIRRIRQQGGDLRLAGMKPEVYDVYELLEFRTVLAHFPDQDEALASFAEVDAGAAHQG